MKEKIKNIILKVKTIICNCNESIKVIFIGILISLFAMGPYLNNIIPYGHDLGYHLNRINEIANGLNIRKFPVLIHSGLIEGLGYGNGFFYPQIFLYIPAILISKGHLLVIPAYKILLILITFVTFISMYYSSKGIFKSKYVAWISTILYIFSLYRLSDIYVRAALGEILAFAFAPLILYGFLNIINEDGKKWWVFVLGTSCLIYSHLLSVLIIGSFFLFLTIINIFKILKNKKIFLNLLKSLLIILIITSAYWGPMLEQKADDIFNVDGRSREPNERVYSLSLSLSMALSSKINGGFATDSSEEQGTMSEGVGIVLIMLALISFTRKDIFKKENRFELQILIMGCIYFIATTKLFILWKYLTFLSIIQFPFRLNTIVTLCFSLVGANTLIKLFEENYLKEMVILFSIFYLIFEGSILDSVAIDYTGWNGNYDVLTGTYDRQVGNAEYLPDGTYIYDLDLYNINDKDTKIEFTQVGNTIEFNYSDQEHEMKINIPLVYYKGYCAYIIDENGQRHDLDVTKYDVNAHVLVSSDEVICGKVIVTYKLTNIQKVCYITSIIGIMIIITYLIIYKIKNKKLNIIIEK